MEPTTRVMSFKELVQPLTIVGLVEAAKYNPDVDTIIKIEYDPEMMAEVPSASNGETATHQGSIRNDDWCVAGSSALAKMAPIFWKHIPGADHPHSGKSPSVKWAGDGSRIYVLSWENPGLLTPAGRSVGLVHSLEKSIPELLLTYDLPYCRAAFDSQYNWYISTQCLTAIVTGRYPIPRYMISRREFKKIIASVHPSQDLDDITDDMFRRLTDRIRQFREHGFMAIPYDAIELTPWMVNELSWEFPECEAKTSDSGTRTESTEQVQKALNEFHLMSRDADLSQPIPSQAVAPQTTKHVTMVSKSGQSLTIPFPQGDLTLLAEFGRAGFVIERIHDTAPIAAHSQSAEVPVRNGNIEDIMNLCTLGFAITGFTNTGVTIKRSN